MKRPVAYYFWLPMLIVMLLPPFTCLTFEFSARQHARERAELEVQQLQQQILTGVENSTGRDRPPAPPERSGDPQAAFLRRISHVIQTSSSPARLLILTADHRLLFPQQEEDTAQLLPLSALYAALDAGKTDFYLRAGAEYVVRLEALDGIGDEPVYAAFYCSTTVIRSWVHKTTLHVLLFSTLLTLVSLLCLWNSMRRVSDPLRQLCAKAAHIGEGSFLPLEEPFRVQELDRLRLAMNETSARLARSRGALEMLLQGITHDLRNPLSSVIGYAQGIELGLYAPPQEAARNIQLESRRMAELLENLSILSHVEESVTEASCSFSVTAAAADCLDRFAAQARQRGLTLRMQGGEREYSALGSSFLFSAVLDNLLSNALRYASSCVEFGLSETEDAISLSVLDDGEGIAADDLPYVFDRNYKGPNGHMGLGLFVARTVSESMGGSLTVANAPAGGAVFTLTLKRADPPASAPVQ